MEKPLLPAWVGAQVGWGRPLCNRQGRAYGVSQVDGDLDMVLPHYSSAAGRAQKRFNGHCLKFYLAGSCQMLQFLLYAIGPLQGVSPVLELRGNESV